MIHNRLDISCAHFPESAGLEYSTSSRVRRLIPAELKLWLLFVVRYPKIFDKIWFDVFIARSAGDQPIPPKDCITDQDKLTNGGRCLRALRADVIGRQNCRYRIIELHINPTEESYLRLERYQQLANIHWANLQWLPPLLITDTYHIPVTPPDPASNIEIVIIKPN